MLSRKSLAQRCTALRIMHFSAQGKAVYSLAIETVERSSKNLVVGSTAGALGAVLLGLSVYGPFHCATMAEPATHARTSLNGAPGFVVQLPARKARHKGKGDFAQPAHAGGQDGLGNDRRGL